MVSALGLLSCWGVILFLVFGFVWLCSDDEDSYYKAIGCLTLGSVLVAIVASVVREAIINW